jgi:general secretion pathway protein A
MMNVLDFFELKAEPFANSPDGRFFFESAQHAQVMARLRYVAESMKGLGIVVGDIGAGKTTLARRFMETLSDDEYEAALLVVVHASITSDWLLTKIAMQLGVDEPAAEKVTLLGQLYARLREIQHAGRRAVVLIDEAQMLRSREIMQELRGLLNLELPGRKLLSLIFFGLPDVDAAIALDPPLAQRVALRIHLQALPLAVTEEYIKHRLRVAGARQMLFSREAVAAVHEVSRGTPRVINTLCDNAMLEAYLLKRKAVGRDLILSAARDLGLVDAPPAPATAVARAQADPLDPRIVTPARAAAAPQPRAPAQDGRPAAPSGPRADVPTAARTTAPPRPAGAPGPAASRPPAPQAVPPRAPAGQAPAAPRPARAIVSPRSPAAAPAGPAPGAAAPGVRPVQSPPARPAVAPAPAKPGAADFESLDDLLADLDKA